MRFWIGTGIVVTSILLGYLIGGGHLTVLLQPAEIIIIVGVGIGSFIIANSSKTLGRLKDALRIAKEGASYSQNDYLDSLLLQFTLFREARVKGMLALESHIDNPEKSAFFQSFPLIMQHEEALNFLCDYLRIMSMGCEDPFLLEGLMDQELEVLEEDNNNIVSSIQTLADAAPALGIVAAVLGVIHTMGAIDQPPAALGKLIAGALVGTFLGVLIAYGFLAPIAHSLKEAYASKRSFLIVIRTGILAYLNDQAPIIAVEFARKNIDPLLRPSFEELEKATRELKRQ